ncbi:30S ribosomal protein S21 [Candidatus Peregrinibacteria bacterium]|nr:30S ribosomal protein S21 [Candidatus Peregrinibacteria bacterium]
MIYAIKKQNESNERLMSRFKKIVQRSRIMETKRSRYHEQKPTKKYIREAAVKRAQYRKKREKAKFYS